MFYAKLNSDCIFVNILYIGYKRSQLFVSTLCMTLQEKYPYPGQFIMRVVLKDFLQNLIS